jgi:DNA (cytosine-5)-methyltransferase 1
VPQARHRIIIVGIRNDIAARLDGLDDIRLKVAEPVTVDQALQGLPRLRSGLSREPDGNAAWARALHQKRLPAPAVHF